MNGLTSRSAREQEMHRKKSARRSKNQSMGLPYYILPRQHHCRLKQVGELRLSGQLSQKTVRTQGLPDVSCTEEMESAAFESNTAVALRICVHI